MEKEVGTEDNANEAVLPTDVPVDMYVAISDSDQLKLLVPILRVELKKRCQSVVSNKTTMQSRLNTTLLTIFLYMPHERRRRQRLKQKIKQEITCHDFRQGRDGKSVEGDDDCPDLIALIIYDTKPVYFLSMACNALQCVTKTRQVYNVDSGEVKIIKFLLLNQIDDYNNLMRGADIADQLRSSYRPDH